MWGQGRWGCFIRCVVLVAICGGGRDVSSVRYAPGHLWLKRRPVRVFFASFPLTHRTLLSYSDDPHAFLLICFKVAVGRIDRGGFSGQEARKNQRIHRVQADPVGEVCRREERVFPIEPAHPAQSHNSLSQRLLRVGGPGGRPYLNN